MIYKGLREQHGGVSYDHPQKFIATDLGQVGQSWTGGKTIREGWVEGGTVVGKAEGRAKEASTVGLRMVSASSFSLRRDVDIKP